MNVSVAREESLSAPPSTDPKYLVLAELGRGGMATAYLAAMQGPGGFNKLVVIKRLRPALAAEPEFLKMFLEEARLAARIEHPNVVHTTEVGFDGKYNYIAMEYLEGQALESVFRRLYKLRKDEVGEDSNNFSGEHELPLKFHLHIITQALQGLDCAHELRDFDGVPLNVVHRDVSPHNIVVTYDGHVKLLDFGIAKAADSSGDTRTGVLKGKCAYMPAEQFGGKSIDRRADVFAVGVILWQALTGRRLWRGLSDAEIFQRVASGTIASPRSVEPSVPEALDAICMKALALKAEDRFATAVEFQTALDDVIASTPALRTSSRELGKFVAEKFEADRAKLRSIIETQMGKGASLRSSEVPSVGFTTSNSGAVSGTQPVSPVPSKKRLLLPTVIGAIALATVIFVTLNGNRNRARAAAQTADPAVSAIAVTNDEAKTSVLHAHAIPDSATITFDGAPMDNNPALQTFRRDDVSHRLEASAPGYASKSEWVTLNQPDITVEFTLDPLKTVDAGRAPSYGRPYPYRPTAAPADNKKTSDAPPPAQPTTVASPPSNPQQPQVVPAQPQPAGPKLDKGDPWAPAGH